MLRFFFGVVLGLVLAVMPVLAAAAPVKVNNIKSAVNPSASSSVSPTNRSGQALSKPPMVQTIDMKIRAQRVKIQTALAAGTITKERAKTLSDGLHAVQKKQAEFLRQNGKRVLTADQQDQLDRMLMDNAKKMPPDPLDKNKKPAASIGFQGAALEKNKTSMPPDPLGKNKIPPDPFGSQGANLK
jgi:hypothetical protein